MASLKVFFPIAFLVITSFGCRTIPKELIRVSGSPIALIHVRVIDGTGALPKEDQTIIIENSRIREIGEASRISLSGVAQTLDLAGYTVLPGLVGMHDHLFYALPPGSPSKEMLATFPKLYLASGVTSLRTAGTLNLDAEVKLKKEIDRGRELGPHLYLSSPYVDPNPNLAPNPKGWAEGVEQLVPLGINSVKVYTHARSSELAAVIQAAHRHGIRVTGHLCAVGFTEAALLGIDNLEHGVVVDTEFYSRRQPDICPNQDDFQAELAQMDVRGAEIQGLTQTLIQHRVAVTSTLPVFESFAGSRTAGLDGRTLSMLSPELQDAYREHVVKRSEDPYGVWDKLLREEMQFEREFVKAGGLLLAGTDPTGWGGVIAGFGDQRELELLVEAGFTVEEAVKISTHNGALFLGQNDRIGTLSEGKQADMFVVRGNPAVDIKDIRRTEIVFKDGVGYDSAAILKTIVAQIGLQ